MIDFLKGNIEYKAGSYIVMDVHDIGYAVFVNENYFSKLKEGDAVKLYVYQHIRENVSDLYGFFDRDGLDLFKLLLTVSGVGPKSALSILSKVDISDIRQAIADNNPDFLIKEKRISKKTAERIVIDLKNKINMENLKSVNDTSFLQPDFNDDDAQAKDALIRLGYSNIEAINILKKMPFEIKDAGEKIKWALKNM